MKMCPKAGSCGACAFNGVKYSKQLDIKFGYINSIMRKFGPVAPIIGMKDPFYYRNKIQSVFGMDKNGVINGIYRKGTHEIIPISGCMLEDKDADSVLNTIKQLVKKYSLSIYDEDLQSGFLRHVLIKRGAFTNQIMVVLVTGTWSFPAKDVFIKDLISKHPNICSIMQNKNNLKTSMVLSEEPERLLYGKSYIEDKLCSLVFRISAKSFYQVNPYQAERLYKIAVRMAQFTGKEKVIDAYCGTGTIGLIAAANGAGSVIGIEKNESAVSDAIENAKANGIENASFICGDASDVLKQMAKNKETVDVVFLDPPRAGSNEKFLSSLIKLAPKTIVYISCNPITLERDLLYIYKMSDYNVIGFQPVDMFPQTAHVETCVLMSKAAK